MGFLKQSFNKGKLTRPMLSWIMILTGLKFKGMIVESEK